MRPLRVAAASAALIVTTATVTACSSQPEAPKACKATPPAVVAAPAAAPGAPITALRAATLPRTPLSDFDQRLPALGGADTHADTHGVNLGGIGSDLFPAQAPDEYWMITDRGPNAEVKAGDGKRRTFPVPSFDPTILKVKLSGGTLAIVQSIPITTTDGRPVTGLSNSDREEPAYDVRGIQRIPANPAGLDTEGMVRAPNGEFWVAEEYSPSILRVSPTGTVLARYVPEGTALPDTGYPVVASLPAIVAKRKVNRGFESLAISPDGKTLYSALQSPLSVPDKAAGEQSRAVRLFALDPATGKATAEYVYPLEPVAAFDPGASGDPAEMKISAMAWYGPNQLLVDERTDEVAKLYTVTVDPTRSVLGGPFDDPATSPSLEQSDLAALKPLDKTLTVDLTADVRGLPKKIEGIAVRDQKTIVVANDNDFGVPGEGQAFGTDDRICDSGAPSQVLEVHIK